MENERELFEIFSALFTYPGAGTGERAGAGAARLAGAFPSAATALGEFAAFARPAGPAALQELYTAAFDLQPVCAPYLGHQLCGEDQRRGLFLLKLQEIYRAHGLTQEREMADHLSEVLRFLATAPDSPDRRALIADGLLPVLGKMAGAFSGAGHPYGRLLDALWTSLESSVAAAAADLPQEAAHD